MRIRSAVVWTSLAILLGSDFRASAQDIGGLLGAVIREIQRSDSQSMETRTPQAGRQKAGRRVEGRWIVVASRMSEQDAISLAESYVPVIGPTFVTQSQNGRYAIVASYLAVAKAKENKEALSAIKLIPADSFLSDGRTFRRIVWSSHHTDDFVELVHQPVLRNSVSRLQAALGRLQLYTGEIDGAVGPATAAAFRAYVSAYGPVYSEVLDEAALRMIEANAADGFKSEEERRQARTRGFQDSTSYREAVVGGFDSYYPYRDATSLGFETRVEYEAFKRSGFTTKAQFDEARKEGFNSKTEAETQRRELLDRARKRAGVLIEDAEAFLRLNPDVPGIIEMAQQAAALTEAVSGRSYAEVDERAKTLDGSLAKIDGFDRFRARRAKEREEAEQKAAGVLREKVLARRAAMKTWIAHNLTHKASPDLADEVKKVDSQQAGADSTQLAQIETDIEELLRRWGIEAEIDSYAEKVRPSDPGAGSDGPPPIARTVLNAFLLEGRGDEIVAVHNASSTAPSLVRNLAGNLVFETGRATVCAYPDDPAPSYRRAVAAGLEPFEARAVDFLEGGCTAENIASVDVALLKRGDFLLAKPSLAAAIFERVDRSELRKFDDISDSALRTFQLKEVALRSEFALDVERGARKGFGGFVVRSEPSALCVVISEDEEVHDALVSQVASFIQSDGHGPLSILSTDPEDAYKAFQRRECSALYASAPDLKTLSGALARDGAELDFVPLWFDAEVLKAQRERMLEAQDFDARQREQRRIAAEEAARLEAKQEEEYEKQVAVRTQRLRQQNGVTAKALETYLAERLRAFTLQATPTVDRAPVASLSQQLGELFPNFVAWYRQSESSDWKAERLETTILEYGRALWKERRIDAIAIRAEIGMVSPERGERRGECFVLGLLVDDEFRMNRDPVQFECSKNEALDSWRTGHQLESLWTAQ